MELIVDLVAGSLWVVCFIALISKMGGNCPPNTSKRCDLFNWSLAWAVFNAIAWYAALYLDIVHLYEGLNGGQKLTNVELMAHIRQSVRDGRF